MGRATISHGMRARVSVRVCACVCFQFRKGKFTSWTKQIWTSSLEWERISWQLLTSDRYTAFREHSNNRHSSSELGHFAQTFATNLEYLQILSAMTAAYNLRIFLECSNFSDWDKNDGDTCVHGGTPIVLAQIKTLYWGGLHLSTSAGARTVKDHLKTSHTPGPSTVCRYTREALTVHLKEKWRRPLETSSHRKCD